MGFWVLRVARFLAYGNFAIAGVVQGSAVTAFSY